MELRNSEELHNLYSLPEVTRVISFRTMKWVENAAHMQDVRKVFVEKSECADCLQGGRITLK
jgi:hypothetical protein